MKDPRLALLENLFTLQRLANALADDSGALLRQAFDDLVAALVKLDPTAVAPRYRRDRLARLIERVEAILAPAFDDWHATQRAALADIGANQAERATLQLAAALGDGAKGTVEPHTGLSSRYFRRIIDAEPMQGAVLKDWAREQKRKTVFRVTSQVRLGVTKGETLDDIVRRVRGRSAGARGKYVGGVMDTTTREAEAIVRTAVNEISTHATVGTYQENADILEGYQLVVTMDGRTSPTCIHYGLTPEKVYPVEGGPRPPFHFNCRTVTMPAIDWDAIGMAPPEDEGTRATATGQKPAGIDFDTWLKSAPPHYADQLLGRGRAQLFREGKVTLAELLKTDGGRVRLTPLAELHPAA